MKKNKFVTFQKDNFNRKAISSGSPRDRLTHDKAMRYEIRTVTGLMKNIRSSTVLDVGCGLGTLSLSIAPFAKYVLGIDISADSVKYANTHAKRLHITNFHAKTSDIYSFKSHDKFDYILVVNVVHHVWDPNKFISVLKSFLATDGKIIIFENNPLNPLFYPLFVLTGNLRSHLTKEYFNATIYSLRKFIRQNGLVTERIVRYAFLPTVLYNYSSVFITVNRVLNSLPIINHFCAFHIVICKKTKNGKTVSR